MKLRYSGFLLAGFIAFASWANAVPASEGHGQRTAFVTFVSSAEQERAARALVRSIRERGGPYRECSIFVVTADFANLPCESLAGNGVEVLPLEMERPFLDYPLALKAFAAAQAEKQAVAAKIGTLVWLDPGVIVLKPPAALDLQNDSDAAVRPVTLANTIGIPPQSPPNDYWGPIYEATGLDYKALPAFETIADSVKVQPYFNCEVFSFHPRLGIAAEWARLLARFLKDDEYQKRACTTFLRRLFLHQAVLSAVIASLLAPERVKALPLASAYPFSQHDKLPAGKRVSSLDELSLVIFDRAWQQDAKWLKRIPAGEPLREWLRRLYHDYLGG